MKPQRKNAGGRKSEQHPSHPPSEPSSVQSAVGGALQEPDSTATNDLQPPTSMRELTTILPQTPRLRGIRHRHHHHHYDLRLLECSLRRQQQNSCSKPITYNPTFTNYFLYPTKSFTRKRKRKKKERKKERMKERGWKG